jgi:hypothetical protein
MKNALASSLVDIAAVYTASPGTERYEKMQLVSFIGDRESTRVPDGARTTDVAPVRASQRASRSR